jgi:hypothetical protein
MRHEWQCSTCGQIFTRKWNCQRHVKDSHAGDGQVVPVSVYPRGGEGRKRNGGKRHRNEGYFYDYRSPAYASGAFAGMGNYYYGQGSLAAAGPYRKNRQTGTAKWDVRWEQARRITENMEKVFKGFSQPAGVVAAAAANRGFPMEIIVGRACEKCMSVSYVPLPDANTGSYDVNHDDVCKNRDKPVEEEDRQGIFVNIHEKISPDTLKQMVDRWLMGHPRYLVARTMSLEQIRDLPHAFRDLRVLKIDAAEIENNGHRRDSEGSNNETGRRKSTTYIIRAIQSSGRSPSVADDHGSNREEDLYGWVALTDDEIVDFLGKARATAMFCKVSSQEGDDGNNSQRHQDRYYYYLKIVPLYELIARQWTEQNEFLNRRRKEMMDEMHAEFMSELKREEEDDNNLDHHPH